MRTFALALVLALTLATSAFATDGVLEINQSCALSAGGCFAGDTAGYPVTISQPGSYRLTGNLTLPASTPGIRILANAVVLDLGGFAIVGPNICSGLPVTSCTVERGGNDLAGISAIEPSQVGVTVRNGAVMGMASNGVGMNNIFQPGYGMVVEDVLTADNGVVGINVPNLSRVTRCKAYRNLLAGISLGIIGSAVENEMYGNGGNGLSFSQGESEAVRNRIRFNGGPGISVSSGFRPIIASGNVISANPSDLLPVGSITTLDNSCGGVKC